jgi:hypothetical protein
MSAPSLRDELDDAEEQEGGVWGHSGKFSSSLFHDSMSGFGLSGEGRMKGGRAFHSPVSTPMGYDYTASLPPVTPEEGREVSPGLGEKLRLEQAKRVRFHDLRTKWENSEKELERLSLRVDEEQAELAQLQSQLEEEVPAPRSSAAAFRSSASARPIPVQFPPHLSVPSGESKDVEMVKELTMLRMANARLAEQLASIGNQTVLGAMRTSQYGRSDPAPLVPFERSLSGRSAVQSAIPTPKVKVPMPVQWKGMFNDHGALEEWIDTAAGYVETAVNISRTEALDSVAAKYHVVSLFSPLEANGSSAASWARMRLQMVVPGVPYTLEDLFNDMRLFWTDPKFEERELQRLHSMNQGRDTANVYLAKFLQVTQRLRSSILTDHMVHRVFLAGFHPIARLYVEQQIVQLEDSVFQTGHGNPVPTLNQMTRWASTLDDRVVAASSRALSASLLPVPASALSAARAPILTALSPARSASKGPSGLLPVPSSAANRSPSNPKELWERRAREFQARFPMEDRKNWPPAREGNPPSHFQCWNCGRTGHWSVACTHARVDPRFAVQVAMVHIAMVYCDLWEETEGIDYEHESYGVASLAPDEEDLLSFDDAQDFA